MASSSHPGTPPTSQRYLALDIGEKRIGIAVSDPLGLTVQPVLTIQRGNPRDDLRSLRRLARRHGCTAVVVGYPLHMSGEVSRQAEKIERFARQLEDLCALPVILWDERLTSVEAHALLYAAGRPRQEHRAVVDQVAAVLILESYLAGRRAAQAEDGTGAAAARPPAEGEDNQL